MTKEKKLPSRLPLKLLRWFCKQEYLPDIEGDLMEQFDARVKNKGLKNARWFFFKDVLHLFRPGILRAFKTSQKLNHIGMLQHNYILALRSFKRHKTSFLIKIQNKNP